MSNTTMTCREFIKAMITYGWKAEHLKSGKTRFTKGNQSYLYSPIDAVRYGIWFNENTLYYENI